LPDFLQPNDCLVLNDTKVVSARLIGKRTQTGGRWEGLFLQLVPPDLWQIMAKTRGTVKPGETVRLHSPDGKKHLLIELVERNEDGTWLARTRAGGVKPPDETSPTRIQSGGFMPPALALIDQIGWTPIPPYIRHGKPLPYDKERYQTVYAAHTGSIAAPTAGLHFTPELLETVKKRGITLASVTLHVGLGTFKPITAENIEEHHMHSEWCSLSAESAQTIQHCRNSGGRIIAIGTTSVRVLESASRPFGAFEQNTSLFIRPPYSFRNVDALLTNFHFPKSTLLILVRTFGGDELIREAYQEAVREEYRFFSYGDAMLIV
jgi:S-adenosylmethionine:tRNA ribosyltransferase-isomerase